MTSFVKLAEPFTETPPPYVAKFPRKVESTTELMGEIKVKPPPLCAPFSLKWDFETITEEVSRLADVVMVIWAPPPELAVLLTNVLLWAFKLYDVPKKFNILFIRKFTSSNFVFVNKIYLYMIKWELQKNYHHPERKEHRPFQLRY